MEEQSFDVQNICLHAMDFQLCAREQKEEQIWNFVLHVDFFDYEQG